MNRLSLMTAVALSGGLGTAGATNLDFGVGLPGFARVGVSDFGVAGGQVAAGLSTRGGDLSYSRALALPPLAAISTGTELQVAWAGGYRLATQASATVGPVALQLAASRWTTERTTFDPLAAWTLEPTDLRSDGWNGDLNLRYRVRRDLVAVLGGEFGGQANGFAGVEYRRDLTRTLPPAEGDDPAAPPETERTGTLSYRAGARAGKDLLAVTAGASYAREDGKTFALDAQLGHGPAPYSELALGLSASATLPDVLGEGSSLRAYAAYEPWRTSAAPLRLGLEASKPLGNGNLSVNLRGGQNHAGETGFGLSVGYSLRLGPKPDTTGQEGSSGN